MKEREKVRTKEKSDSVSLTAIIIFPNIDLRYLTSLLCTLAHLDALRKERSTLARGGASPDSREAEGQGGQGNETEDDKCKDPLKRKSLDPHLPKSQSQGQVRSCKSNSPVAVTKQESPRKRHDTPDSNVGEDAAGNRGSAVYGNRSVPEERKVGPDKGHRHRGNVDAFDGRD